MARLSAFSRDLQIMVDRALSPKARSALIADHARNVLRETQAHNRRILGSDPEHMQIVDRVEGAPLEAVDPDHGVIVFSFDVSVDLFAYIGRLLLEHSPVLTGAYQRSHQLYADHVPVDAYDPKVRADEWVFLSTSPYARKIERGQSDQAPDGVYQGVAAMAAKRYGNVASVRFSYRSPMLGYVPGGANRAERAALRAQPARLAAMKMERATRVPAIVVRMR
jgi:hypothetical protein